MRTNRLLLFALLLGPAGCGNPDTPAGPTGQPLTPIAGDPAKPDARVLGLFGGKAGWEPLVNPVRVEAFRIESHVDEAADPQFAGYPVIAGPVEVDPKSLRPAIAALASEDAYGWDFAKGCGFQPGVGLRFVGKEGVTEILLCFSCDELSIRHDGEITGGEDIDDIRTTLVQAVKPIFPDDPVVQELQTTEELQAIAEQEERKRAAEVRRWAERMPEPAVEALLSHDQAAFQPALDAGLPKLEDRIPALLHFAGGPNGSWSSSSGVETWVLDTLKALSADELADPVHDAILGDDRLTRRGAIRVWLGWRSPLADWSPDDLPKLRSVALTVMEEARYYPTRQSGLRRLEKWAANLPEDEVDRRLESGLHDPHESVRRSAMLAAGRLGREFAIPELMARLRGEKPRIDPLPDVPEVESQNVPEGFDDVAGKRPEAEVAALALGYLKHAAARADLEAPHVLSPMHEVAFALLGDVDHLRAKHFAADERNQDLQLAAVDAVVRAKGRRGLDLVLQYEQATHWWEEESVVRRVTTMLLDEKAPGTELLERCESLEHLAEWYDLHGEEYESRFTER